MSRRPSVPPPGPGSRPNRLRLPPGVPAGHRPLRGFGLVEVLVALALLALAALALGLLQARLHESADAARQRTEATRHAQARIESLRQRAASLDSPADWQALASGQDAPEGEANVSFERRWRLEPARHDLARRLVVELRWTDRRGEDESLWLTTMLARGDPRDRAALVLPPSPDGGVRRLAGHPRGVPAEAIRLRRRAGPISLLAWPGERSGWLAFGELDAGVTHHCRLPPDADTDLDADCEPLAARLLEGYITGALPAGPLLPSFDRMSSLRADPARDCVVETVADPLTGVALADTWRFRCLMQAVDDDDPRTPAVWSARLRWNGLAPGQRSCRYLSPDPDTPGDGDRESDTYTRVAGTLRHRNFLLTDGAPCPTGTVEHPGADTPS